jgi:hypothetical protein
VLAFCPVRKRPSEFYVDPRSSIEQQVGGDLIEIETDRSIVGLADDQR